MIKIILLDENMSKWKFKTEKPDTDINDFIESCKYDLITQGFAKDITKVSIIQND